MNLLRRITCREEGRQGRMMAMPAFLPSVPYMVRARMHGDDWTAPARGGLFMVNETSAGRFAARLLQGVRGHLRLVGAGGTMSLGDGVPDWPKVVMTLPSKHHLGLMALAPDPLFLDGYVRGW